MLDIPGYEQAIQIHDGKNSQVFRVRRVGDGKSVILKIMKADYPTTEQLRRYRQEYQLTHQLGLSGTIAAYSLENYRRTLAITFEDFGAISLKQWITQNQPTGKLAAHDFLPIAIKISECLAELHKAQIIHKDINPANIVINPKTNRVKLIDLGIATQLSRENPTLTDPTALEGTLAYISPEQTGRMNRSLDYRSDFYSLGITFFEILTGGLPFITSDPLELIHCHLAKPITSSSDRWIDIPEMLLQIILKLTAKNAEDRYQTAWGLKFDLETCWHQCQATGLIQSFELGRNDIPNTLQIPQKLYGRDQEVQALLAAFDLIEIKARQNLSAHGQVVCVTGYSGIGKSSLVKELYKPITAKRGYFAAGKFDQFQRNIPYSALAEALTQLVHQLLGASDLYQWREKLQTAVGKNGRAIIEVVPEIELILGEQPPIPDLGIIESQNRFNLVFQAFLSALCSREHPLVIFLDDLQWADSATLKLLERITINQQISYLLLIITYRDNEVISGHPLAITLDLMRQANIQIKNIHLQPLQIEHIQQLLSETLRSQPDSMRGLAELIIRKTQGNPFFTSEFLKAIYNKNLLRFVESTHSWQWEPACIETEGFTDNVVDLILENLQKLPLAVQELLSLAAFLGTEFDLRTLELLATHECLNSCSVEQICHDLKIALREEFILPRSPLDENLRIQEYQFVHDRIQQASYALVSPEQQSLKHWRIGNILLKHSDDTKIEEQLFQITEHLNRGLTAATTLAEKNDLAQLNLRVGQKAMKAAAYKVALSYLEIGLSLLEQNAWEQQYEFCLALHDEAVKAAFLSDEILIMENLATVIKAKAKTALDLVKSSVVLIEAYGTHSRIPDALATGLNILKQLGIDLPEHPQPTELQNKVIEIESLLAGRSFSELISLPPMTDPQAIAAIRLLNKLHPVAFISSSNVKPFIILKSIELELTYGNSPISAISYMLYGLLWSGLGDLERAYEYGQIAIELLDNTDSREFQANVLMVVSSFINPWKIHLNESLESLQISHRLGLEGGDLTFSGYAGFDYCTCAYLTAKNLTELEKDIQLYSDSLKQIGQHAALAYLKSYHQTVLNLLGRSEHTYQLSGSISDETVMIATFQQQHNQAGLWHLYTAKLPLCFLFENYELAYQVSNLAKQAIESGSGGFAVPILNFYESLSCLALVSSQANIDADLLQQVQANQQLMKKWSDSAPMNYLHKFYLVEAERYRYQNEKLLAIEYYDLAIATARTNQYLQEEALAYELAAKFYLAWGKEILARAYMVEARYCYLRWGANAKVKHLEANYPNLCQAQVKSSNITNTSSGTGENAALDLVTVMRSTQAISSEIVLENLLRTLMKLLLESAGAQIGYLILHSPVTGQELGKLTLEAYGNIHTNTITILASLPIGENFPTSILYYVARSKTSLVLDHASINNDFMNDPYIQTVQPLSILCYPLLNRNQLVGIVYLENNLVTSAFTPNRIALLQMLSSQAAISLENAKLYTSMEQKVAERTAELDRTNAKLTQANEELSRLAILDGLTKVANRRRFDQYLEQEWKKHLNEQHSLALILIDIDYFKRYNDRYGHQGGDDCLRSVAQAIAGSLNRPEGLAARYGGEEFAVILPNTEISAAMVIAESIRTAIHNLNIPHEASDVKPYVTLSLGVATYIPTAELADSQLIASADAALYQAKQLGRDRAIASNV